MQWTVQSRSSLGVDTHDPRGVDSPDQRTCFNRANECETCVLSHSNNQPSTWAAGWSGLCVCGPLTQTSRAFRT